MTGRTIGDIGEFGLIDEITSGLSNPPGVRVGPGDDCAVFSPVGEVTVSTDAMVENVHFRRSWSGPNDIGRKAVASTVADAEAMGARPVGIVMSLSAPADTPAEWVRDFTAGVRAECEVAGAALLGGDISGGAQIGIVTTVFGDLEGRTPVLRSGACPGDVVAYTGQLGMAAAGLAVLSRGFRSPGAVVRAYRVPEPPYGQGIVAQQAGATAMIDCSDGLVADLGHIARASGVAIDINPGALNLHDAQQTVAAAVGGGDPLTFVLTGGEDHALLATFPGNPPPGWTVIGRVLASTKEPSVTVAGVPWEDSGGWRHF